MMIETTQAILNERGESSLPRFLDASGGRCIAAHFGTYDYTASCSITAAYQVMDHPACDFAKHMMQVAFAGHGHLAFRRRDECSPRAAAPRGKGQAAHARAAGGKSRSRSSRLAAALRTHPAFARFGVLPGMGPASGAASHALRGRVFVFSRRARFRRRAAQEFRRESGEGHARRRCVRRRRHGTGPAEFFPARDQLRSDQRSGSGTPDRASQSRSYISGRS